MKKKNASKLTAIKWFEFVCGKRSRYSNRTVIVIHSNRAFSVNYSQCSYTALSKSFTLLIVLLKSVPMNQLHGIALSPLIMHVYHDNSLHMSFQSIYFQKFP